MEEGERNTKYFLSLEKRNGERKVLTQLRKDTDSNNKLITNQQEVICEVKKFYENLYKKEEISYINITDYLAFEECTKLSKDESEKCDGVMTISECKKVVFSMKQSKSPGIDGLPIEFYKIFWEDIEQMLVNALNESFKTGQLSESQRKGIITLIFKKGCPEKFTNWRPVS